jgi:rfaE bifunctional protein nucleotidyltransferase chain/domain
MWQKPSSCAAPCQDLEARQLRAKNQPLSGDNLGMTASVLPPPAFLSKLCVREDLATRLPLLPRPWIFTNGVFDILHRGHVSYLAQARSLGGSLILGLNSDASARSLGKGPDRPLNAEGDRACVLAALESISLVVLFDESTPCELLHEVRPDLYVKGGDYDMEQLEETRLVRSWGGDARAIAFVDGYSTTALVRRIRS